VLGQFLHFERIVRLSSSHHFRFFFWFLFLNPNFKETSKVLNFQNKLSLFKWDDSHKFDNYTSFKIVFSIQLS